MTTYLFPELSEEHFLQKATCNGFILRSSALIQHDALHVIVSFSCENLELLISIEQANHSETITLSSFTGNYFLHARENIKQPTTHYTSIKGSVMQFRGLSKTKTINKMNTNFPVTKSNFKGIKSNFNGIKSTPTGSNRNTCSNSTASAIDHFGIVELLHNFTTSFIFSIIFLEAVNFLRKWFYNLFYFTIFVFVLYSLIGYTHLDKSTHYTCVSIDEMKMLLTEIPLRKRGKQFSASIKSKFKQLFYPKRLFIPKSHRILDVFMLQARHSFRPRPKEFGATNKTSNQNVSGQENLIPCVDTGLNENESGLLFILKSAPIINL